MFLFGSDTWVVNPRMGRALGRFQYQVAIQLTGRILRQKPDGKWTYTSAETEMEEAGFHTMEEYIRKRKNKVTQYIVMRSLLDLCEELERALGDQLEMRWWE